MATALYDKGRQKFGEAAINWASATIKMLFVDTDDYSVNLATHDFHDDVTSGGIVATSGALDNATNILGVMDADDELVSTVSGDEFEAIVIWKDTGVSGTSPLIAFIDNYTGLPCTPNGGNITVAFPSDSNKIFKL